MADSTPGEVGDMQKSIHASEVDEDPEIGDIFHCAFHNCADIHIEENFFSNFRQAFLNQDFVRKDDVFTQFIDFNDSEVHILTDQSVEVADGVNVDLRARQEGVDSEYVHHHTAFNAAGDSPLDNFLGFIELQHFLPGFHKIGFALGKHQLAFLVFNLV